MIVIGYADARLAAILGVPIVVSDHLPLAPPPPGVDARRIVRHGMADVLAWLGEPVGPRPGERVHAVLTGGRLHVSTEFLGELRSTHG